MRAPGRTMAEAERERQQRRAASDAASGAGAISGEAGLAPRDAGSRFGAFHRARRAAGDVPGSPATPESPADSGPPPAE
ncbi:hypothetical protein ABZ837_42300 [Streptomyces sp. NPDC047197]|uniref:hypothetical protein n=1 Tax=Streptomyces sp. NPDC047197 TaxID=3155477 RepID=UPI0033E61FE4